MGQVATTARAVKAAIVVATNGSGGSGKGITNSLRSKKKAELEHLLMNDTLTILKEWPMDIIRLVVDYSITTLSHQRIFVFDNLVNENFPSGKFVCLFVGLGRM
jgi:hypothetical protein